MHKPHLRDEWCNDPFEHSVLLYLYQSIGFSDPDIFKREAEERYFLNHYLLNFDERTPVRRTGKTTKAIFHFIYHRFFLDEKIFAILESNHQFYEKVRIESEISIIALQLSRVGAIDNFCQTKIVILMDRPQDVIGRDLAGSILFKH
jgi:hypothetical protein